MRFAWVTYDEDALVVIVEAEDHEAGKRKVAETMLEEGHDPEDDDPMTIEDYLDEYGETWRLYGLSEQSI